MKTLINIILFILLSVFLYFAFIFVIENYSENIQNEEEYLMNWQNKYDKKKESDIIFYSNFGFFGVRNYYIFDNFSCSQDDFVKLMNFLKNTNFNADSSSKHLHFFWNKNNNHKYKVEYMNEDYILNNSSLFDFNIEIDKKPDALILSNFKNYNSIENYCNQEGEKMKVEKKYNETKILFSSVNKFNFCSWSKVQKFLNRTEFPSNHEIEIYNCLKKKIAVFKLIDKKNKYILTIYF